MRPQCPPGIWHGPGGHGASGSFHLYLPSGDRTGLPGNQKMRDERPLGRRRAILNRFQIPGRKEHYPLRDPTYPAAVRQASGASFSQIGSKPGRGARIPPTEKGPSSDSPFLLPPVQNHKRRRSCSVLPFTVYKGKRAPRNYPQTYRRRKHLQTSLVREAYKSMIPADDSRRTESYSPCITCPAACKRAYLAYRWLLSDISLSDWRLPSLHA